MTLLLLYTACTPQYGTGIDSAGDADTDADTDADSDADSDTDTDTDTDTNPFDDTITLPDSPFPIEVRLSGAASETVSFDRITCSHPPNNQLQLTYDDSGSEFAWNMRVLMRETFTGAGTFNTTIKVEMYENFSGGRYFSGDETTGASVTIEAVGANGAYGDFTVDELTGDAGDLTLAPLPIEIWCDTLDD